MTQDLIVTLIACAAIALLVIRSVRRRRKPQGTGACASCPSETSASPSKIAQPPNTESAAKPLAFFGGSGRKPT